MPESSHELQVRYKDVQLDCGFRMESLIERELAVELKSVEKLLPVHDAQLSTYLRLAGLRKGLLIKFNSKGLRNGVRRLVRQVFLRVLRVPDFPLPMQVTR